MVRSTVNSKEKLISNHNDGLIITESKWNKYDKYRIGNIRNWLIRNDFIDMNDHYNTLLNDIHTLELILN